MMVNFMCHFDWTHVFGKHYFGCFYEGVWMRFHIWIKNRTEKLSKRKLLLPDWL